MSTFSRKMSPASPGHVRQKMYTFNTLIEDQLRDPAFRAAWQKLKPQRRIVTSLLRLRAAADLSQRELAVKAGWQPAYVSRLESFPGDGDKLHLPDLSPLKSDAQACGFEVGLVFGCPKGRSARVDIATTAGFGDDKRFRCALGALAGCMITAPRSGPPQIAPMEKSDTASGKPTRRR